MKNAFWNCVLILDPKFLSVNCIARSINMSTYQRIIFQYCTAVKYNDFINGRKQNSSVWKKWVSKSLRRTF